MFSDDGIVSSVPFECGGLPFGTDGSSVFLSGSVLIIFDSKSANKRIKNVKKICSNFLYIVT